MKAEVRIWRAINATPFIGGSLSPQLDRSEGGTYFKS
jgi:hypothetical protein